LIQPTELVKDPHLYKCLKIITKYDYINKSQQIKPLWH